MRNPPHPLDGCDSDGCVVDGVGDGGGMMRRWCGCGDEVRGGCDDGDDDESGGVMAAAVEW
ncbi:hypothetical protein Tco_0075113, partial [Tanacetum coccineum]